MHLKVTRGEMGSFSPISYLVCTFEQKAMRQFVVCGNICPIVRGVLRVILIGYFIHAVIACLKNSVDARVCVISLNKIKHVESVESLSCWRQWTLHVWSSNCSAANKAKLPLARFWTFLLYPACLWVFMKSFSALCVRDKAWFWHGNTCLSAAVRVNHDLAFYYVFWIYLSATHYICKRESGE